MKSGQIYHIKILTLVSIMIFMIISQVHSQTDNIKFSQISVDQGLSQSSVFKIYQDSRGFFWFGTEDGLNRYDGNDFVIYNHKPGDSTSIIDNVCNNIDEDADGNMWLVTPVGVSKLDIFSQKFSNFPIGKEEGAITGYISDLKIDKRNNVWLGTNDALMLFNWDSNRFEKVYQDTVNGFNVSQLHEDKDGELWIVNNNGIYQYNLDSNILVEVYKIEREINFVRSSITEDGSGNLWMGARDDIFVFNIASKKLEKLELIENEEVIFTDLAMDHDNNIWAGTFRAGLFKIGKKENEYYEVNRYNKSSGYYQNISDDHVTSVFVDKSGILWLGSLTGGINKSNLNTNFSVITTGEKIPNANIPEPVFAIYNDDKNGELWIGTYGFGLYLYDKDKKPVKHYSGKIGDPGGLVGTDVMSLVKDHKDNLWVCTYTGGLQVKYHNSSLFVGFTHPNLESKVIIEPMIYQDNHDLLWIGTRDDGLISLDVESNELLHYKPDKNNPFAIDHSRINCILDDEKNNRIWIGLEDGVNILDRKTNNFYKFSSAYGETKGLLSNYIMSLYLDIDNNIWIATDQGLSEVVSVELKQDGKAVVEMKNYSVDDGFSNDVIYGILEDSKENLWLSTNKGIVKFNKKSKVVRNYYASDGLQGNEFNMGAFFKSKSGEMFFGGINGVTTFYPEEITENTVTPKMAITKFLLFNKVVEPQPNGILSGDINEIEKIVLGFQHKVFSFEIAALEFTNLKKKPICVHVGGF